jgi:hypothetical protein
MPTIDLNRSVGPYTGISYDQPLQFETVEGTRKFWVLLYGAYNAMGLIGSECNGIAILDEDKKAVLLDEFARISSGWFGPSRSQVLAYLGILELEWDEFKSFVNGCERRRYYLTEDSLPLEAGAPKPDPQEDPSELFMHPGAWQSDCEVDVPTMGVKKVTVHLPGDVESAKLGLLIAERLPHGSGIDYDWSIRQNGAGNWRCSNSYHGTDESGGHCCIQDFTAILRQGPDGAWDVEVEYNNGDKRHRHNLGLKEYLCETIQYSLNEPDKPVSET